MRRRAIRPLARAAVAQPAILFLLLLAISPAQSQTSAQTCGNANASADQTISSCTQLLRSGTLSGSDLAVAYNNRGVGYLNKNLLDEAISDFDQALHVNPGYLAVYLERAVAYLEKGQADRAISDYTQALRISPNLADAYYKRGLVHQNMGQDDLAIADYTQALRIKPTNAVVYYYRGIAYHSKGHDDLASADFNQALRINPNLAPARAALQQLTH